jgi:hypothetical protein
MTTLYVANRTRQVHDFEYRMPGSLRVESLLLEPGTQQRIGEAPLLFIEAIIEQHRAYGLMAAEDVPPKFTGICYSIDKPVPALDSLTPQ